MHARKIQTRSHSSGSVIFLPDEVLAHVFSFCNIQDLGRLSLTCKRFKNIVDNDNTWKPLSRNVMISNQVSVRMRARCASQYSSKDKVKISRLWFLGTPEDRNRRPAISFRSRFIPQIELEASRLWYSRGSSLMWRERTNTGSLTSVWGKIDAHFDDITHFLLLPNHIVTGGRDNQLFIFSRESNETLLQLESVHDHEVHCLACNNEILISVGRNADVKVYGHFPSIQLLYSFVHEEHIWAASIIANRNLLLGSAAWTPNHVHPLQLLDIERNTLICTLGDNYRVGAGISCICPESNNEVYTGSYDTSVRLWDLRTPTASVRFWEDPFDSSIVSLSSDYHNTLFAGTQRYGFICLYDKRANNYSHFYYVGQQNSPVYSVSFDATRLFAGLDRGIYVRTFGNCTND